MNERSKKDDIENLNSFLRGERSAVETYNQAIEKLDDPNVKQRLQQLCASHETRVRQLEMRVRSLGGSPDQSSGAWGSFAKLFQGGANVFGKSAAVSALEEGEDHGKRLYQDHLDELTNETREFIQADIMPEQYRTHDALSQMQQQMRA